mmetsp:Transcript_31788/g.105303  ORF Transcript_31788/g.105303 Transcript_31788/m.105303 type:complete len:102 (-) Transcript_31788:152-457(-)
MLACPAFWWCPSGSTERSSNSTQSYPSTLKAHPRWLSRGGTAEARDEADVSEALDVGLDVFLVRIGSADFAAPDVFDRAAGPAQVAVDVWNALRYGLSSAA